MPKIFPSLLEQVPKVGILLSQAVAGFQRSTAPHQGKAALENLQEAIFAAEPLVDMATQVWIAGQSVEVAGVYASSALEGVWKLARKVRALALAAAGCDHRGGDLASVESNWSAVQRFVSLHVPPIDVNRLIALVRTEAASMKLPPCPIPVEFEGVPRAIDDYIEAAKSLPEGWAHKSLQEQVELLNSAVCPPIQPKATILALGERVYQIGDSDLFHLTDNEDSILQAFLEQGPGTMDQPTLDNRSGITDAAKILRKLQKRYGGIFAPAITCPGRKGRGGYHVRITDSCAD
jgi:hypothetical protein